MFGNPAFQKFYKAFPFLYLIDRIKLISNKAYLCYLPNFIVQRRENKLLNGKLPHGSTFLFVTPSCSQKCQFLTKSSPHTYNRCVSIKLSMKIRSKFDLSILRHGSWWNIFCQGILLKIVLQERQTLSKVFFQAELYLSCRWHKLLVFMNFLA